jgi:hypothetical protein
LPRRETDEAGKSGKDPFSLKYWQAVEAFGQAAVEGTLRTASVSSRHSELLRNLSASDEQTKREITLPGEVVFDIVTHPECKDDYYADPDGRRLYSVERRWRDRGGPQARGHVLLDSREALQKYGAYCLFMASDRGIGYKDESD